MKKLFSALLCIVLFVSCASFAIEAEESGCYILHPGRYKVGTDIPTGNYDVRFNNLDIVSSVRYSTRLTDDGQLDMSAPDAFSFLYSSNWNQAIYAVFSLYFDGYLDIDFSSLNFWPE